jgi:tripartite-type tricarboxylate transporter receptor subunit TctC
VARAPADGYTLGLGSTATLAVNPALFRRLAYDPKSDFTLVTLMATTPNVVVVPTSSTVWDMASLVSRAREVGGRSLRFSSPGNGTTQHLAGVLLNQGATMSGEHVPYRGPAEAVQALAAGEVEWGFASLPSAVGQIRGGLLRALAISTPNPALPDVSTLAAQGFQGFEETDVWFGSMVPRATPAPVVARLHHAMRAVLDAPGFDARLAQAGYAPAPRMTPAEFAAFAGRQIDFWGRLVQASGASID